MGLTYVNGNVTGPRGESAGVRFLVDSGATYSLLPHQTWTKLGIEPEEEMECTLVDGTVLKRRVGVCDVSLLGKRRSSPVILGELNDDEALLGAITLENFGLVLDPFSRKLSPLRVRL